MRNSSAGKSCIDRDEIRKLLREDKLRFYRDLCDHEWEPSHQELANVGVPSFAEVEGRQIRMDHRATRRIAQPGV
jgi:hypothetical protein